MDPGIRESRNDNDDDDDDDNDDDGDDDADDDDGALGTCICTTPKECSTDGRRSFLC